MRAGPVEASNKRIKGVWAIGLMGALLLSACGDKEVILPGARENLRSVLSDDAARDTTVTEANRAAPIRLAAQQANADWTQRSGTPSTRTAHPALGSGLTPVWSVDIGAGDSRKARITADPVVAGGRVFTLDSAALVTATTTAGAPVWSRDLVPPRDRAQDASGGGLAYGDGKLFVSSGFGLTTALDPATGNILWQQKLEATGTGSPTVYGKLVYLVAGAETAWALDTDTGRIAWQLGATPEVSNVFTATAPAVTDSFAVFAFGSGEVAAVFRKGGLRRWGATLSGQRRGIARGTIGAITGDPVIAGDVVYTGTQAGRLVALRLDSGERLWTAEEGVTGPVWLAGDSVFLVSDRNELVRLDARDGARIWGVKLPFFAKTGRPTRQKEIFAHYGPVVAGGRVIVASGDGLIREFDPATGALTGTTEIPGGASTNPVIAGGTLYVVSGTGQLQAFR